MTVPFRRRRTDRGSSPHERAQARIAERLDLALEPDESAWLERHLADCAGCRSVADAYAADRAELRSLRRQSIDPPRDLWARTSAAIEREARVTDPARRTPLLRRSRPSALPLGAVAGLMVVAVVFGATLLSGRPVPSVSPAATNRIVAQPPTGTSPVSNPQPTPWAHDGDVDFLAFGDGTVTIYNSRISEVCPENGAACAPLDPTPQAEVEVESQPDEAILSDDGSTLVFVDTASDGTGVVLVAPVPTPTGSAGPAESPTTDPGPTPSPEVTSTPSGSATASPDVSAPPSSPTVSSDPTPTASLTVTPTPTAEPNDGQLALAEDVVLVGAADFNSDGTQFAFSARPVDGAAGPDIYVWIVGQPEAAAVTSDHRSVFSGWVDDFVLGSRPVDPAAEEATAESFILDPATGATAPVGPAGAWRPVVNPEGGYAVWWDGTIELDPTGRDWLPADGRLVVAPWPETPDIAAPPASPETPQASAVASADPLASGEPTAPLPSPLDDDAATILVEGVAGDWQARWDDGGEHLAVWIADPDDPTIGRLTLYGVEDGEVDVDEPLLANEWSLPGFAMTADHLAWATRKGQDGKGSLVKVVAWTEDGIGQVESKPGEDVLVVQR